MAHTVQSPAITPTHRGSALRGLRAVIKPGWGLLAALVLVAVVAAPVIAVFAFVFRPTEGLWTHLVHTLLIEYVQNTVLLGVGVGLATIVIGTGCAWLVVMCEFPGRRWLDWALVLPLAMPAYVLAYAYTDFLQFTGPVQGLIREMTGWGWQDYWFPPIHSAGGAIFVLTMAFYPYVYVLARAAFLDQSVCALEVSRTLGCSPWGAFLRVGLPLARPAIATGAGFVVMETLADFGAVKYFEVATFTTGIYRAWFAYGNPAAAAQLASLLLLSVFAVLLLERWSRGRRQYAHTSARYRELRAMPLTGTRALAAMLSCVLPLAFGFVLPAIVLVRMAAHSGEPVTLSRLAQLGSNTVQIGALASLLAVGVALLAVYAVKRDGRPLSRGLIRIALLGYATPGVVIAVGILIAIGAFDAAIDKSARALFGVSTGLVLAGTIVAVLYGCLARFFAVAFSPLDAGLARVKRSFEDVARTLGTTPGGVLARIHLPLMRGSVLTAMLLVFVEVLKELPATMILRPFNFDTLATEAFRFATTERLDAAAAPALIIVAVGLIPVLVLCRTIRRSRPGSTA
ncbi:MAG: ABC transporter permease [Dongiaceae bacterium]